MITNTDGAILSVMVGPQRYAIAQRQIDHLGLLDPARASADQRGRPLLCRELGALLGGAGAISPGRRHAITVSLRRHGVALLADYVDSLGGDAPLETQPLSPLIARRLARPWFLGAVIYDGAPLLLLDLRRIASDVVIGAV